MLKKLLCLSAVLCVFSLGLAASEADHYKLADITVTIGDHVCMDTPASVTLPPAINGFRHMHMIESRDGKASPVPIQVEPGKAPKLWWILSGRTEPGTTRTYQLFRGNPVKAAGVDFRMDADGLTAAFQGQSLFTYNHAHVIPPSSKIAPAYIRSGYIHPMFSPGNKLLTEDFPGDHYHHKGIWAPWTSTKFEGRDVDFWNLKKKQGTVQFAGYEGIENGPVYGRFKAKHQFVDITQPNGGKVVLDEIWDVRIWAVGGPKAGYWIWDITSNQVCVADSPLHLNNYRYGGMGYRGPKEWKGDNYIVLTSRGDEKKNGHAQQSRWCAHSGAIDDEWSTVVMMCHPGNERFPEHMRIWPGGGCFFNYVPIQKQAMDLNPGEKHRFSYRFFVHQGKIDKEKAERVWQDFAAGPKAVLKVVNAQSAEK